MKDDFLDLLDLLDKVTYLKKKNEHADKIKLE